MENIYPELPTANPKNQQVLGRKEGLKFFPPYRDCHPTTVATKTFSPFSVMVLFLCPGIACALIKGKDSKMDLLQEGF